MLSCTCRSINRSFIINKEGTEIEKGTRENIKNQEECNLLTIKNYIKASSLEEAYQLNQKKTNAVLGGMVWMKMSSKTITNAIDLSGLGLDQIEEKEDCFEIGCMVTLRDLEKSEKLRGCFGNFFEESVRHIVGAQFRNCATVGGSIYRRFGFSDVLTCFLALDCEVELYHAGRVPIAEFVKMPYDNDILVRLIVKKTRRETAYLSHRMTATDFPILACAVARQGENWYISLGARPAKAALFVSSQISPQPGKEEMKAFAQYAAEQFTFGSNMRGSKEYRMEIAKVLIYRGMEKIAGGTYAD